MFGFCKSEVQPIILGYEKDFPAYGIGHYGKCRCANGI